MISSTRPAASASFAGIGSPDRIIGSAFSMPTRRGRRCVPPAPGIRPSLISGRPSRVPGAATRKWQPSVISSPPPSGVPCTAAMVGLATSSIVRDDVDQARRLRRLAELGDVGAGDEGAAGAGRARWPRQRHRRAPRANASRMPTRTACLSALTGGLSTVMTATLPSRRRLTTSLVVSCIAASAMNSPALPICFCDVARHEKQLLEFDPNARKCCISCQRTKGASPANVRGERLRCPSRNPWRRRKFDILRQAAHRRRCSPCGMSASASAASSRSTSVVRHRAGQILGLIGPNGAGKTTLFNCVSRLYTPDSGDILFEGESILGSPPHRIAGSASAARSRTSRCSEPCRCSTMCGSAAIGRAAAISSAMRCGCRGCAARKRTLDEHTAWAPRRPRPGGRCASLVADLPLGTQKRVELARALAARPKLLLLDEPAGGLNHDEVGELGDLIRRIRDERRHHRAAGRASHEPGDVDLRQRRGARFRPQDRRRHAGEVQQDPEVIRAYLGTTAR